MGVQEMTSRRPVHRTVSAPWKESSRSRAADSTVVDGVMASESDGSRTQSTHHGGVLGFEPYLLKSRVQHDHYRSLHDHHNNKELAL